MNAPERTGPLPAIAFGGFVFWLVAFPMSGALFPASAGLLWFVLPHIAGLALLGHLGRVEWFQPVTVTGTALTVSLTVLLPWIPLDATTVLAVIGVTSAPVSWRAGVGLKNAPSFALAALAGLTAGNMAALLLAKAPFADPVKLMIVGACLVPVAMTPFRPDTLQGKIPGFVNYISFIFAFQIVSGLMYGYLFPAYAQSGAWPGLELLFYMAGAALAVRILKHSRDLTLAAGVVPAMLAFLILNTSDAPAAVTISMFAMMTGAGVIDLFFIVFVLSFANAARAYGYGMAVLCGGIAAGRILSIAVGETGNTIGLLGGMFLNVAVLALFFLEYLRRKQTIRVPGDTAGLPPWLTFILSAREQVVLKNVLANRIYRDIADEMGISESSVKTYMNRIYFKTGIIGKKRLISELCDGEQDVRDSVNEFNN